MFPKFPVDSVAPAVFTSRMFAGVETCTQMLYAAGQLPYRSWKFLGSPCWGTIMIWSSDHEH